MNTFKEWLSDNLRYLLLLLGIAVGVTMIVFGVNAYQTLQMPHRGAGADPVQTQTGSEVSGKEDPAPAVPETEEETEELTEEVSEEETDIFVTAVEELLEEAEETEEEAAAAEETEEEAAVPEEETEEETAAPEEETEEETAAPEEETEEEAAAEEETETETEPVEEPERFNGNVTISSTSGEMLTQKETETETEPETETETETETEEETEEISEEETEFNVRIVYVNREAESETETETETEEETAKQPVKEVKAGLDLDRETEAETQTETNAAQAGTKTETPAQEAETAVDIETMIQEGLAEAVDRDPDSEGPTAFEDTIDPNKTAYLRDEESYLASTDLAAGAGTNAGLDAALNNNTQTGTQGTQSTAEGTLPTPAVPAQTEPETELREIDTLKNLTPVTKYAGSMMNIRTAPDAESEIITSVDTGTELTVNGETTSWYRVMVNQQVGYAAKSLVTDEYTPVYGTLISTCYMRSDADYGDNIIGEYYGGTPLEILENHGGWTKVRIDGTDGFVGTKFVAYN